MLYSKLNKDGDEALTKPEFLEMLKDPWLRTWLSTMDLDVSEPEVLWHLLAARHNSEAQQHAGSRHWMHGDAGMAQVVKLSQELLGTYSTWTAEIISLLS